MDMMKTTSCGVLVLDPAGELLLCHATGSRYWDIPKGGVAGSEAGPQAAVREAREECGLRLEANELLDLGRFDYLRHKELLLYAVLMERFDTRQCVCVSTYVDRQGRVRPEMDAFRWAPFDDLQARCAPSLSSVLTGHLSLSSLLDDLLRAGKPKPAVFAFDATGKA
ncbi:RNA pyrophosphohydrolase [Variovorax sp. SRS16]|uniref:NUDIX hydrolase n=1 Tax=Variovorax sp. SRS16 TaxID=282217 RepID=UPI001317D77F|nr:NUDIX hydrolase [Variovorax sp. SRS16]VTU18077.1 RNA pyrophosphohydrolase [Variovorax sp. SRS16]